MRLAGRRPLELRPPRKRQAGSFRTRMALRQGWSMTGGIRSVCSRPSHAQAPGVTKPSSLRQGETVPPLRPGFGSAPSSSVLRKRASRFSPVAEGRNRPLRTKTESPGVGRSRVLQRFGPFADQFADCFTRHAQRHAATQTELLFCNSSQARLCGAVASRQWPILGKHKGHHSRGSEDSVVMPVS